MKYVELIRLALHDILKTHSESILLGEDISDPYGGAFKATKGLSTSFPNQVLQTPISESGFIGIATGLAYIGYKPIVEIMFGDFITLIIDIIINSASKFDWFSQGEMKGDILIRTAVGGRRGYGPIHSQSLEKLYLGWPNVELISANIVSDPYRLLVNAFNRDAKVKFFLENKIDYATTPLESKDLYLKGFHQEATNTDFPTVIIRNNDIDKDSDVTICCYGGLTKYALEAAYTLLIEDEITSAICIHSMICPIDIRPVVDCVNKSKKLILVEEGYSIAGWSSYVISELVNSKKSRLSLQDIKIISSKFTPIPANIEKEKEHLPSSNDIIKAVKEII